MSGSLPDTVTVEDNRLTVKKVDNAVNTTFVCEVKNKHGASSNQITTFVIGESVRPVGSHAGTQMSTVHALDWHHTQKHTLVKCWDLVLSEGCGGWGGHFLLIFTALFSFFLFLSAGQELAELVCLTLSARVGQKTAELFPRRQLGNCNSDFRSKVNVSLRVQRKGT